MKFNTIQLKDAEHKLFYLATVSGEVLGTINNVQDKNLSVKLLEFSELTFTVYRPEHLDISIVDEKNREIFDAIDIYMKVYVEDIGWFILDQPTFVDDGETIRKECVAHSIEYELSLKNVKDLTINNGTQTSQEWLYYQKMHPDFDWNDTTKTVTLDYNTQGVTFYRPDTPELSLMHIVLEKFPNWSIGYVDPTLQYETNSTGDALDHNKKLIKRIEEYTGSAYSLLNETIANTYKCVFLYDCENLIINAHRVNEVGELMTQNVLGFQTDLYLTHQNILDSTNFSANTEDSCVTMLQVNGGDNVDILDVNIGSNNIYNFEYFYNQMPTRLKNKVKKWQNERLQNREQYKQLSLNANNIAANMLELQYRTPTKKTNVFSRLLAEGQQYVYNTSDTLIAQWMPVAYTYTPIGYNANGGIGAPDVQRKTIGVPFRISNSTPTRAGYTFVCWNTKANSTGNNYQPGDIYNHDDPLVLYACWATNPIVVNYDGETFSQYKSCDEKITIQRTATKDGYMFLGWGTQKNKRQSVIYDYGSDCYLTQDTTLYPYFYPRNSNYNIVVFNPNGGNYSGSIIKPAPTNQTIKVPSEIPKKEGFTFKNWNSKLDGTGVTVTPGSTYTVTKEIKFYAQWTPKTFLIKYNLNGGTGTFDNQTKTYGTPLTLNQNTPQSNGYIFLGWWRMALSDNVINASASNEAQENTNNNASTTTASTDLAISLPDNFDAGEYVENTSENTKGGFINCDVSLVEVSPALTEYGIEELRNLASIYEDRVKRYYYDIGNTTNALFLEAVAAVKLIYNVLFGKNWYYKKTGIENHKPSNVGFPSVPSTDGMEEQLALWKTQKKMILESKEEMFNKLDISKYFDDYELKLLYSYIVESAYEDSTYVITDIMTNEQILLVQDELIDKAEETLSRLSQPQYVVSADILNIFKIEQMDKQNYNTSDYPKFAIGNFITVHKDDYYSYPLRIIGLDYSFDDASSLKATFSNILKDRTGLSDLDYLLKNLQTASIAEITGTTGSVTTNTGTNGGVTYNTIVNNIDLKGEGNSGYTFNHAQYTGLISMLGTGGGGSGSSENNNYTITEVNKISTSQFEIVATDSSNTIVKNVWSISEETDKTTFTNLTDGKTITFNNWG